MWPLDFSHSGSSTNTAWKLPHFFCLTPVICHFPLENLLCPPRHALGILTVSLKYLYLSLSSFLSHYGDISHLFLLLILDDCSIRTRILSCSLWWLWSLALCLTHKLIVWAWKVFSKWTNKKPGSYATQTSCRLSPQLCNPTIIFYKIT